MAIASTRPSGNILVEGARNIDADAIVALILEVAERHVFPTLSPAGCSVFTKSLPASVQHILHGQGGHYLLASDSAGGVVGVCGFYEHGHVVHLFVRNNRHGSGIGRTLLGRAAWLVSPAPNIDVTLNASLNATGFYDQLGFVTSGPVDETNGIRFVPMAINAETLRHWLPGA